MSCLPRALGVLRPGATPGKGAILSADAVGYGAVLLATACWGTSGVFAKLILTEGAVSALALAFWRNLTTFIILLVGLGLLRPAWLRVRRSDIKWLVALGGSLGALHVFWFLSVSLNGAAVAVVQQAAMPAIVAVAAWLLWRESLSGRKLLAILLTFLGTVLVSGVGVFGGSHFTLSGLLVGLGTPLWYAAWNLFGKRLRGRYGPLTTLTYGFGFGALLLFPLQFNTPQPWPVSTTALLWFAGFIAVATIAGYATYTFALGRLPASVATILAMAEIPFATLYAYALLGERLAVDQVVGAMLVMVGVFVLSWRRARTRVPIRAQLEEV